MHDSGKRQEFTTGAVRDTAEGKPRIDLISPFAEARLGAWSALGAAKYSDRNWEAGMPFSRVLASLCRHLNAYRAGDRSEDHLAAVMWNAMALAHGEEMVKRGVWAGALADLPDYGVSPAEIAKAAKDFAAIADLISPPAPVTPAQDPYEPPQPFVPVSDPADRDCFPCRYGGEALDGVHCSGCFGTEEKKNFAPQVDEASKA